MRSFLAVTHSKCHKFKFGLYSVSQASAGSGMEGAGARWEFDSVDQISYKCRSCSHSGKFSSIFLTSPALSFLQIRSASSVSTTIRSLIPTAAISLSPSVESGTPSRRSADQLPHPRADPQTGCTAPAQTRHSHRAATPDFFSMKYFCCLMAYFHKPSNRMKNC